MEVGAKVRSTFQFFRRSPVLFVSLFYVGAVLGLVMQEVAMRIPDQARPFFNQAGFGIMVSLIFIGPAWGVLRAVWLLANNSRRAESVCALVLSLPLIFVIVGSVQRRMSKLSAEGVAAVESSRLTSPSSGQPSAAAHVER